jgi:glutamate racemase
MIATTPRILVFDSGVGGLSIVQEIRALLPMLGIDYVADNAFFPYGTRHEGELLQRVVAVIDAAITRLRPALVVIGCNSASTIALDLLRERFDTPFVGVVPAIKPAAKASTTKTIGLLATEGTIMRDYTRTLARQFAHDCTLVSYGSSDLVLQAEQLLRGQQPDRERIRHELHQLWSLPNASDIDAVVLGCTHFPLLKPLFVELAPANVQWVDSGAAIARRVSSLLPPSHPSAPAPERADHAFFTGSYDAAIAAGLRNFGFRHCAILAV